LVKTAVARKRIGLRANRTISVGHYQLDRADPTLSTGAEACAHKNSAG